MTLDISALDGLELFAVVGLLLLLLGATAMTVLQARKARRLSESLARTEMTVRLRRLLPESDLTPRKVVLFSSPLSFAYTAGLLSPKIYISTSLVESFSDGEVKAVLRHHQSHLRRRDPLRGLLVFFFSKFFFFFPWADKFLKVSGRDSELIADRYALLFSDTPSDLASALVKSDLKDLPVGDYLPGFAGDNLLSERLSKILNLDSRARIVGRPPRISFGRILDGAAIVLSLSLLVIPAGAGFQKKSPWVCSHVDHVSCCAPASKDGPCTLCRS